MFQVTPRLNFMRLVSDNRPVAQAEIAGGKDYPQIGGYVNFYPTPYGGVIVEAEVFGLPDMSSTDASAFYAFHVHEYGDCSDDFSKTGGHYNPENMPHPKHAGDMPPLLSNQGYAWLTFYDRRFELADVIGKSVIIHQNPDDFTTQPSGNAGEKIACGVIHYVN